MTKEKKQLRELSEEELKEVTGGSSFDCSQPENRVLPICKDRGVTLQGETWGKISIDTQFRTGNMGHVGVIE